MLSQLQISGPCFLYHFEIGPLSLLRSAASEPGS